MRCLMPFLLVLALGTATSSRAQAQDGVYVNGRLVGQEQFTEQLAMFGIVLPTPVQDGAYWYDRLSGLWGLIGGPTLGQLPSGLELGGPLREDASGGQSSVFINGRTLHPTEVQYLQMVFGCVIPGRYWMNAQGIGGPWRAARRCSIWRPQLSRRAGAGAATLDVVCADRFCRRV